MVKYICVLVKIELCTYTIAFYGYIKNMLYIEFKKSAHRHLVCCKRLIEDTNRKGVNAEEKHKLISEAYYLSGYVLEAMLSYSVCSFLNITGDCMQSKPFTVDKNKFMTHDLTQKYRYACGIGLTHLMKLKFFSNKHPNNHLQEMFAKWNVRFRYETCNLVSKDNMSLYINEIEEIYQCIIKLYSK